MSSETPSTQLPKAPSTTTPRPQRTSRACEGCRRRKIKVNINFHQMTVCLNFKTNNIKSALVVLFVKAVFDLKKFAFIENTIEPKRAIPLKCKCKKNKCEK